MGAISGRCVTWGVVVVAVGWILRDSVCWSVRVRVYVCVCVRLHFHASPQAGPIVITHSSDWTGREIEGLGRRPQLLYSPSPSACY